MTESSDRILTTHVGSLPRSQAVTEVLFAREREESRDSARDDAVITAAVAEVVRRQVEVGIDLVSDGEMSKISYATYIARRLSGFGAQQIRLCNEISVAIAFQIQRVLGDKPEEVVE